MFSNPFVLACVVFISLIVLKWVATLFIEFLLHCLSLNFQSQLNWRVPCCCSMNFKPDFFEFPIYVIGEREHNLCVWWPRILHHPGLKICLGVKSCTRRKYNWFSEINFDRSLALFKRRDNDHTFKIKKSIQTGKQMTLYFNRDIFLSFCFFQVFQLGPNSNQYIAKQMALYLNRDIFLSFWFLGISTRA